MKANQDENFQIKFIDELSDSEKELCDFSSYDVIVAKLFKLCTQCGVKLNEKQFDMAIPQKTKFERNFCNPTISLKEFFIVILLLD